MIKFNFIQKKSFEKLPKSSGVYCFKNKREMLYIGKAADIKERIKQHLKQSNKFFAKLSNSSLIGYHKTQSEIEALILEAELIKKYKPKYNVLWRDDKNYFFVAITKERLPIVFITHRDSGFVFSKAKKSEAENHKLKADDSKLKAEYVGPFVDGRALKQTLKYLRKIFPYYTVKKHPGITCPWCHLNLCPGPNPNPNEYKKSVKNLISVLKGGRKSVLPKLKKEMRISSKEQNFEKAARIRDQIYFLEKILSHAKIFSRDKDPSLASRKDTLESWPKTSEIIQRILKTRKKIFRIEAYDISNIQGKHASGSLVTFIGGRPVKDFYRKFRIKIAGKPNDTAMIKEVIARRIKHKEWALPDLILIDGGRGQLNAAKSALKQSGKEFSSIHLTALAKKKNELFLENRQKPILLKNLPQQIFNLILHLRDEAHRFAISYHRKLRSVDLFGKS